MFCLKNVKKNLKFCLEVVKNLSNLTETKMYEKFNVLLYNFEMYFGFTCSFTFEFNKPFGSLD